MAKTPFNKHKAGPDTFANSILAATYGKLREQLELACQQGRPVANIQAKIDKLKAKFPHKKW